MQDGIIKGTGNSWSAKTVPDFLTLYPTYEAFAEAFVKGELPLDFALNPSGWAKNGDPLNKATLLKDATAKLYGLSASAVPDDILAAIQPVLAAAAANSELSGKIYYGSLVTNQTNGGIEVIQVPRKPVLALSIGRTESAEATSSTRWGCSISLRPDKMLMLSVGYSGSVRQDSINVTKAEFTDNSVTVYAFANAGESVPWLVICE